MVDGRAKAITSLGVAHGIDYMHKHDIVHCDLKPSKILFDKPILPMIGDLDVARVEADYISADMTRSVGTDIYMAPEAPSGHYDRRVDYFSFGPILYELFEGARLFSVWLTRSHSSSQTTRCVGSKSSLKAACAITATSDTYSLTPEKLGLVSNT